MHSPITNILIADFGINLLLTGIVLIGEIGGQAEEKASEYLRNNNYVRLYNSKDY